MVCFFTLCFFKNPKISSQGTTYVQHPTTLPSTPPNRINTNQNTLSFLNHFPLKSHTNISTFPHYPFFHSNITHTSPKESFIIKFNYKNIECLQNPSIIPLIFFLHKSYKAYIDFKKIGPLS